MSNLQSIAGGFAWMFTALMLIAAALEPVSVATVQAQAPAAVCLDATGSTARPCPVYIA